MYGVEKESEGLSLAFPRARFGKQWPPELYFYKLVVVWEFTSNHASGEIHLFFLCVLHSRKYLIQFLFIII